MKEHYNLLATIKLANLKGEPIGFKELCRISDHHSINDFIFEATSWGMIKSQPGETKTRHAGINLVVTHVGDVFLEEYSRDFQE